MSGLYFVEFQRHANRGMGQPWRLQSRSGRPAPPEGPAPIGDDFALGIDALLSLWRSREFDRILPIEYCKETIDTCSRRKQRDCLPTNNAVERGDRTDATGS